MSEAINFHWIYPRQSSRSINNSPQKQQHQPPTNQLIQTYLSSAAQYLNRTKSFHVPQTATSPADNNAHQQVLRSDNLDLARSVPSNINHLNSSITPIAYHEHRFNSSIATEVYPKSDGIVNSLRRSLKNKRERFSQKRSSTMKSCQSLNNQDESSSNVVLQRQISMTPTLICRHQYLENNPDLSSINFNRQQNDDDGDGSETDDQIRKSEIFLRSIDRSRVS